MIMVARSEIATVYTAGVIQGIALVTFPTTGAMTCHTCNPDHPDTVAGRARHSVRAARSYVIVGAVINLISVAASNSTFNRKLRRRARSDAPCPVEDSRTLDGLTLHDYGCPQ